MTAVASAQLHEAIATAWVEEDSLDDAFTQYWTADNKSRFEVLNDGEAGPETPFPYAVFSQEAPDIKTRMSGDDDGNGKYLLQEAPFTFKIYANSQGSQTAKEVVGDLVERVLKRFGGHPTEKDGEDLVRANGEILQVQYDTDYGARVGDNEYMWTVKYNILTDVPVAAG